MLGRVADQLYWMARYSERTENMAHIIDVRRPDDPDAPIRRNATQRLGFRA